MNVLFDLTGNPRYLDAGRQWSGRMLAFQQAMKPSGAYYMNYGREPGSDNGDWYVADCASMALGIISTAVRCRDDERARYLNSVTHFCDLVCERFVRDSGGITVGYWEPLKDEYWCATAVVAAMLLRLHDATGNDDHKAVAFNAVDWLAGYDLSQATTPDFASGAPSVLFYMLEALSTALPCLDQDSERGRAVKERLSEIIVWMIENQNQAGTWDYHSWWGTKLGGFPLHMLIYDHLVGQPRHCDCQYLVGDGNRIGFTERLKQAIDKAMTHLAGAPTASTQFSHDAVFGMGSLAEYLAPGAFYRGHDNKPHLPKYDFAALAAAKMREDEDDADSTGGIEVRNALFEEWDENHPKHWLAGKGAGTSLRPSDQGGYAGQASLLMDVAETPTYVYQITRLGRWHAGQKLVFSAAVKAFEQQVARLGLRINVNGDWRDLASEFHCGDARWGRLVIETVIPAGFGGGEMRLLLFKNRPTAVCLFDDVRVKTS